MDGQDDKQQPITDFPGSEGSGGKAKASLSEAATESQERSKGKGTEQPVLRADVPQMDTRTLRAPSPEPITKRPGSIFDLVEQARSSNLENQEMTAPAARDAQGPSGNWNSANFVSPLPLLAEAIQATSSDNLPLAFQKLAGAQAAVDLLTPDNVRIILNDLEKLKRDLPQEMDSTKRAKMQERIALGTELLDSRWQCPLRLAFATFQMGAKDGQPPVDAYQLLQAAAKIHPELRDDPELKKAIENVASLYGNMAPAVKQAMEQAVFAGVQVAGQSPQERSAFQTDPQLATRLAEQGRQAQLESPDPYVHAREAEVMRQTQGVLSQDARLAHTRAIDAAKKIKNAQGDTYTSLLAEIEKTKKDVTGKQDSLATLQEQIAALKQESKAKAQEIAAISAERAKEDAKAHSKNMWDAACVNFSRTLKQWNGEAEKEASVETGKIAEMTKIGNELRKLEAQRKTLEGEIKTGQDSIKGKQTRLAEVGKPITEEHVKYAKALLTDADARVEESIKAKAEGTSSQKSDDQRLEDIATAAQQLNRAEKIAPELAKDKELQELKNRHSIVTTSITDNVKTATPEQLQELDDRFLRLINGHNLQRTDELQNAIASGAKPPEELQKMVDELNSYKSYFPELKEDSKLRAAIALVGRGEKVTEEALAQEATVESKALKLNKDYATAQQAMEKFGPLYQAKQFKDAEEAYKTFAENHKSVYAAKKEVLAQIEQGINTCQALEALPTLRAAKQAAEMEIAQDEAKILGGINALYLTPPENKVPQENGKEVIIAGPGYKPEQALQALAQAKEAYPGIEKNPLYEEQLQLGQGLQKNVKEMEIQSREDAEKAKEAGIDLTASLTSWGAAAAAGAAATAGLVAAGVMVAGAPITVPAALAIVGITTVTGALVGGTTKWGLANALDAKDKDFGSNMSKGALIGGTSGIGGGGLKVGGMVLSGGLALSKTGGTIYKGVQYADVAAKVSKVTPLNQTVGVILKSAKGDLAKEIQVSEKILESQLKTQKITEEAFQAAKAALGKADAKGLVNKIPINCANVLKDAGINMSDDALTAAGLKMNEALNAGGTKAIDAGWRALQAGKAAADTTKYRWWQVPGHWDNAGKIISNNFRHLGDLAAYSTPYVATRTAFAGTALGTASGFYNTGKYGSKFMNGEINEVTREKWTAGEAFTTALSNTAFDTGIGLAGMGVLRGVTSNRDVAIAAAETKTLGAITFGGLALKGLNKFTGGAVNKFGKKIGEALPKSDLPGTLLHDNIGFMGPFVRNVIPLSTSTGRRFVLAQNNSDQSEFEVASRKSELMNEEIQVASEEGEQQHAQPMAQSTDMPIQPMANAVQANEPQVDEPQVADAGNESSDSGENSDLPQPITDS